MSTNSIISRVFFVGVLVMALALFIAFVSGRIDLEELPENDIFESTYHFHGEVPPDIVDFLVDLEENEETGDCTHKQITGET
jgi:hypothetical protein